jgi:hypothetical protein
MFGKKWSWFFVYVKSVVPGRAAQVYKGIQLLSLVKPESAIADQTYVSMSLLAFEGKCCR